MDLFSEYITISGALSIIHFSAFAYLALVFSVFFIGKVINDLLTPYNIDNELTGKDNKALAVSYIGYLIGQGIIILGVFNGPDDKSIILDLRMIALWSLIGILLLNLSRIINDKIIFNKFDNKKEIIKDRNVGTGAIQFGSYVGTAFIINAIISGESEGLINDILGTIIFFICGQLGFILFTFIYQKITTYDVHAEIEKDNIAAGVSFGATLVAIGVIMSHSIQLSNSLLSFLIWFINGVTLIVISRIVVDKIILPKHKLDDEICKDRNWGVALIEGGTAIIVAFLINVSFS